MVIGQNVILSILMPNDNAGAKPTRAEFLFLFSGILRLGRFSSEAVAEKLLKRIDKTHDTPFFDADGFDLNN